MPGSKFQMGPLRLVLMTIDSLCVVIAYAIAVYLAGSSGDADFTDLFKRDIVYLIVFTLVWWAVGTDQGLFVSHRNERLSRQLIAVARTVVVSLVFTVFVVLFFRRAFEREFTLFFGTSALLILLLFRLSLRLFLWYIRRHGYNFRHVIIVGINARSRSIVKIFSTQGRYGYHVVGIVDDDPLRMELLKNYNVPYLGPCNGLETILANQVVDEVYISLPVRSFYETIRDIAHLCEGIGVPVRMTADLFPLQIAHSRVSHLDQVPLLSLSIGPEMHGQLMLKRLMDFTLSSILLSMFSPLFLAVAAAIKLESKGPVFFNQERVGLNGRRFKIVKFRSMVVNAEELRKALEAANEADGPVFKMRHDPRITHVGRFIRKYSIDELPQLFNVWMGQMSLVGPRPPIPSEVEQYSWDQRRRLSVKPGMTGLWQVSGRSDVSFDDWVDMDLAYIDTWSLAQDVRILIKTFQVVVQGRGAA